MRIFGKVIIAGLAAVVLMSGNLFCKKVDADTYLDIQSGKDYSIDLKSDRVYGLRFTPETSGDYQIYSTGSNCVTCEMKKSMSQSYDPKIIDYNSGSYCNFKLKVYLEAGKQYLFKVYLGDMVAAVNANDTKVRIDKYVDKSDKVVAITTKNFPDIIFRVMIDNEFDTNGDGYLSKDEISDITTLKIQYDFDEELNVKSVKGIEYLSSLKNLYMNGLKDMEDVDLSKNTALEVVQIQSCDCKSINLKNLNRLRTLELRSTPIKSLDLSSATLLEYLNINESQIKSLDLSKQTELKELNAYLVKGISFKNLKNCARLKTLDLSCSDITSLDLTGLKRLTRLVLENNKLTTLDLQSATKLTDLLCCDNELTSIKFPKQSSLRSVYIENNHLTSVDLSGLAYVDNINISNNPLTKLDISKNPILTSLECQRSDLKVLDISYNPALQKAYKGEPEEYGNSVTYRVIGPRNQMGHFNYYLCVPKTTEIKVTDVKVDGVPLDEAHFPDPVLRGHLKSYDYDNDGVLKGYEIDRVTLIDLVDSGLKDLRGIEYVRNLKWLYIEKNDLTTLDLRKNKYLESVYCRDNKIKSIKLNNPKLEYLVAPNNQITSIDLSGSPYISYVDVSDNKLTSLDLTGLKDLNSLKCFGNKIKKLDIVDNPCLKKTCKTGEKVDTGYVCGYYLKTNGWELTYDKSCKLVGAVVEFSLDKKSAQLVCGKTQQLKATLTGSRDTVTWKTSDSKIASVDKTGKITAKQAGKVTITASAAGKSLKCQVQVLFKDVTNSSDFWYVPTYYLANKGVVKGYDNQTLFKPANKCTRAQMVTFIWRFKGSPEPKSKTCKFTDVKKTDYYYKACIWGNEKHIVEGYKNGKFGPKIVCARRHAVTFLWRLANQPAPKSLKNKFKDVKKSDYFFKATLWASEKKILVGYDDGTFRPNGDCLRRQMVTLLYKYDKYVNGKG